MTNHRVLFCGDTESINSGLLQSRLPDGKNFTTDLVSSDDGGIDRLVELATNADAAIIVVDAKKGITASIHQHALIVSLLGIRNIVLAVVGISQTETQFDQICADYLAFTQLHEASGSFVAVPIAANGDDSGFDWCGGKNLAQLVEETAASNMTTDSPFRFWVDEVAATQGNQTKCNGRIVAGTVRDGNRLKLMPSAKEVLLENIELVGPNQTTSATGREANLELQGKPALNPGEMICAAKDPAGIADLFETTIIWLDKKMMIPGRRYKLRMGGQETDTTIFSPKHRINIKTFGKLAAKNLKSGEIGVCSLSTANRIAFDPYLESRHTGCFDLLDRRSGRLVGKGVISFALRRSSNIHWQSLDIDKSVRSSLKGHGPCVLWFTGLSGSGKSAIANILEKKLVAEDVHTVLLDGDNVRHGLNRDLGFTETDRVENIRRIGEVSKLMVEAGLIVLVSFISPFRSDRRLARSLFEDGEFFEVYIDTPLEVAEQRDVKGLYKRARRGEIKNFTGIDSPYEEPENAELSIDTVSNSVEEAADLVLRHLLDSGIVE